MHSRSRKMLEFKQLLYVLAAANLLNYYITSVTNYYEILYVVLLEIYIIYMISYKKNEETF